MRRDLRLERQRLHHRGGDTQEAGAYLTRIDLSQGSSPGPALPFDAKVCATFLPTVTYLPLKNRICAQAYLLARRQIHLGEIR